MMMSTLKAMVMKTLEFALRLHFILGHLSLFNLNMLVPFLKNLSTLKCDVYQLLIHERSTFSPKPDITCSHDFQKFTVVSKSFDQIMLLVINMICFKNISMPMVFYISLHVHIPLNKIAILRGI